MNAPSPRALWAGGSVLMWLLYALVFLQTTALGWTDALATSAANVAPLAALALAVWAVLRAHVMPLPPAAQAAAHAAGAVMFAFAWYALVIASLAVLGGLRGRGYAVRWFEGPAFTWQVFQGLVIYALVAALCYAIRGGRDAAPVAFVEAPRPMRRFLAKLGDGMRPVEVDDIVRITGAQDYTEVRTLAGAHLVRLSLGEWEQRLDGDAFVRVHRSAIIALAHMLRAEPLPGGRMVAVMRDGERVEASRAGAAKLRSLVV